MKTRLLFISLLYFFMSSASMAVECSAVFTNGLQNNDVTGVITFGDQAQLRNSLSNVLDSSNAIVDNSGTTVSSCGSTGDCTNSGNIAEYKMVSDFGAGEKGNISVTPAEPDDVDPLTIDPGNYGYLDISYHAILILRPGDYYFTGDFNSDSQYDISIDGDSTGIVRIFVQGDVTLGYESGLNANGNAEQLLLYAKGDVTVMDQVNISGFIYSAAGVILEYQSNINGAISAKDINLVIDSSETTVNFSQTVPEFGDFCGVEPTPVLSCDADSAMSVVFTDDFSSIKSWYSVDFDRDVGNWPDDERFPEYPQQEQSVVFSIDTDDEELKVAGHAEPGNHNEYGMVGLTLSAELINSSSALTYSLYSQIDADIHGTNNDVGIVFGYQDDQNYYLARWVKYGTSYRNDDNFPGEYRTFELVKVVEGIATQLDGIELGQNLLDDHSDKFSMKVIVNSEGTAVCTGESDGDNMVLRLSSSERPTLYDMGLFSYDNDKGVTFDDVEIRCDDCSASEVKALALYRFEQENFDTQINDTSGNNNHAENIGGISSADGKYCRGFDSNGDSKNQQTDHAFRSKLNLSDDVGLQGTISFWFNSDINWSVGKKRVLFDASQDGDEKKYFVFEIKRNGQLKFSFVDSEDKTYILTGLSNSRTADTWYYLSVTWDFVNDYFAIYVDGDIDKETNEKHTSNVMGQLGTIVFGDNASTYTNDNYDSKLPSPYSSRGNYDEVRIYNSVLSQEQIQQDMADTMGCNTQIDHFEIDTLDAQGLTCQADTISIKSCGDAACDTDMLYTDAVDVVLSVSDGSGVVLNKTLTVVGGEVTVDYIHTTAEDISLSLEQSFECKNDNTACDVTFASAGFRFVAGEDNTSLPVQLSGKGSDVGYNAEILTIEAVQTDDTGACAPLLVTGESIEMAASYETPNSGSAAVNISGVAISMNTSATAFDALDFTGVALDFGDDEQYSADYIFTYPDAGVVQLHARYELPDDDGEPSGDYITGSSSSIIVRPFAFDIFIDNNLSTDDSGYQANPAAINASGTVFTVAGDNIRISTRAVAWKAGDDANANGIADEGEDLSSNTTTENFTDIALSSLSSTRVAPATDTGELTVTEGGNFAAGIQVDTAVYDEVGIISLTSHKDDYLTQDVNITGTAPYVGRFTPAYFTQTVYYHGSLKANHDDNCLAKDWAYAGQHYNNDPSNDGAITYDGIPIIEINAFNLNGELTQNYTESDFMKLVNTDIEITAPTRDDEELRLDPSEVDEKIGLTAVMSLGDDLVMSATKGVINYTFNEDDHFIYEHTKHAEVDPFFAKIPFLVTSVADSDGINLYTGDSSDIEATTKVIPDSVGIRFGRWQLESSYGPETSPLFMDMTIQYFNGSTFVNNTEETCLIPAIGTPVSTGNIGDGGMDVWDYRLGDLDSSDNLLTSHTTPRLTGEEQTFDLGLYQSLIFSAPDPAAIYNRQGSLEFEYQVPLWLQYDWNNDDDFTNNPTATLTFGLYRGNDRIIYQREIEN